MTGTSSRRTWVINVLLLLAVFLAVALPRWLIVAQAATADETKWVARAANFSAALSGGDLANTYQSEHPGVTTMWAGTLGLKTLFPDYAFDTAFVYAAQNPSQLEPYELDAFLLAQGYTPLQALAAGRRVMIIFNALALTLVFVYARRLLDLQTALLAAAFSALSPFFAAHTHLMHLDGLAGSLMVLSLMAFLYYAKRQKGLDLLIAGAAAGLACLTKTPAFVLAPILFIITLLSIWQKRQENRAANFWNVGISYLAWAAIALFTFILLWPAMWVEPLETLNRIFLEALGYAGGGHGNPVFFKGTIYSDGRIPASVLTFYPLTYLWRSTPVVLLGLALAVPALWRRWSPLDRRAARDTIFALLLYALLFTLFMNLGGKKFDRYLIPIYPALHLVSAAGWVGLVRWITKTSEVSNQIPGTTTNAKTSEVSNQLTGGTASPKTSEVSDQLPGTIMRAKTSEVWLVTLVLLLLAAGQFLALRSTSPYPLSYYNPLLGGSRRAPQVMQIGWGEGLDAAGRYLSNKPGSRDLTVASWYRSTLAYYFDGATISIKAELTPEEAAAIQSADYAVLYIHQWQRDVPPALLDEFAARVPEHIIEINGLEYARIYDLRP